MGGFEVPLLGGMDPPMKHHSVEMYVLTPRVKRAGDSIWWVVLVGRYPSKRRLTQTGRGLTRTRNCGVVLWNYGASRSLIHFKTNKFRGSPTTFVNRNFYNSKVVGEESAICWKIRVSSGTWESDSQVKILKCGQSAGNYSIQWREKWKMKNKKSKNKSVLRLPDMISMGDAELRMRHQFVLHGKSWDTKIK